MSAETRAILAEQQRQLLKALCSGDPVPVDFDRASVETCGASLLIKRGRAAARSWPALERMLGERDFVTRFLNFARQTPLPEQGGPLSDGYAFAISLGNVVEWTDEARLEKLAIDIRYRWTRRGLILRRAPTLRILWIRKRQSLVLAIRLPWIGVRTVTLG